MMRYILNILLALAVSVSAAVAQTDTDGLWGKAENSYTSGNYAEAAAIYDSIYRSGYSGAKLFYNMGNAYFKDGQTGRAILNYTRAQHLAPSDSDIDFNLRVANARVVDKIDAVPVFFMKQWVIDLREALSTNAWAWLSVLFFAVGLCAVCFYLLSTRISVRKSGFYGGIVFLGLFVVSVVFAAVEKSAITDSVEAIVMSKSASVKSSPDNNSKDIFVLHEGTKLTVVSTLSGWSEVVVSDGNKGWINNSAIERVF